MDAVRVTAVGTDRGARRRPAHAEGPAAAAATRLHGEPLALTPARSDPPIPADGDGCRDAHSNEGGCHGRIH
jgi:hypothetical protein